MPHPTQIVEINIDAMVGPTHHFGGLGVGNVASQASALRTSNPQRAALEGIEKMRLVASLGVPQFFWLPPTRPRLDFISQLGFAGTTPEQLHAAARECPQAVSAAFSSAYMWAANSATITPACDSRDSRYHATPANLISSWHRSSEAVEREADLQSLFVDVERFQFHAALPPILPLRDEGAANHMRLCDSSGTQGVHVFVHGTQDTYDTEPPDAALHLPRHTEAASKAIARQHQLNPERVFFLHQHPDAISAGVFHNDVIATSHENVLLHHERAFWNADLQLEALEATFQRNCRSTLQRIEVSEAELPLADAVKSYFFNSQLLTQHPAETGSESSSRMALVCPQQCEHVPSALALIHRLLKDDDIPIVDARFVPLAESMANGGGPACLRLRVPIDRNELPLLNQHLRATDSKLDALGECVEAYYPEQLDQSDFTDPDLLRQVQHATDTLRQVAAVAMH